eukprot:253418-Hanusia_phi.AAC.1
MSELRGWVLSPRVVALRLKEPGASVSPRRSARMTSSPPRATPQLPLPSLPSPGPYWTPGPPAGLGLGLSAALWRVGGYEPGQPG